MLPWWPRGFITTLVQWNFRSTSGRTSGEKFFPENYYCTKSSALKFQGESLGTVLCWHISFEKYRQKIPLGTTMLKNDATVKKQSKNIKSFNIKLTFGVLEVYCNISLVLHKVRPKGVVSFLVSHLPFHSNISS